jgi:hypothetical protein
MLHSTNYIMYYKVGSFGNLHIKFRQAIRNLDLNLSWTKKKKLMKIQQPQPLPQ